MPDESHFSEENQGSNGGGPHRRRQHRGRRKERVLHTRVSEQLSEDIRRLADDLRVPVSNLVRNVLEEVFTVVENVSEDVGDFFEDVVDEAEGVRERIRKQQRAARGSRDQGRRRRRSAPTRPAAADVEDELRRDEVREAAGEASAESEDDILGWQPMVLNRAVACAGCGNTLEIGADAMMAIQADGRLGSVICRPCSAKG